MIELEGKFNSAKVFTDIVDEASISQIIEILNQKFVEGAKIRFMPDVHAGKGCTIGTTMEIKDKVCPNLVGVDIGCGVDCIQIDAEEIDFEALDRVIRALVPFGCNVHQSPTKAEYVGYDFEKLDKLTCASEVDTFYARQSLGSLGGGNHFIEVDKDDEGNFYLVIHTGSRHLGIEVCRYFQEKAVEECQRELDAARDIILEGPTQEIADRLEEFRIKNPPIKKDLAYLNYESGILYLHDMEIVQEFAAANRRMIAFLIMEAMGWKKKDYITSVHNYVDTNHGVLRKGAIAAYQGQRAIIPMNMRDGSLLCTGKGNPDWNYSAPHGAGRLMGRGEAKRKLDMASFEEAMKGIYTTSVCQATLDEAPAVYKNMSDIVENIHDTVFIDKIIKPVYNFKASN